NSKVAADVDGDGYISSIDFGFVRKFILKYIVIFPVEEGAINSNTWGESVTVSQLSSLSDAELCARTIYGECSRDNYENLIAVAWCIINRQTLNVSGNGFYNNSYSQIVCDPAEFVGLTGTGAGEGQGRNPVMSSTKWKRSVEIAKVMVLYKGNRAILGDTITNPIDRRRYFLEKSYYIKYPASYRLNPITIIDNTFFHWKGEGY
ncbi:MAG: hypothetical protein GX270_00150, partial [Clostridiaceae bacterium]|nr:hypothetical protein [Clostridiaceae bacterium]